MKIRLSQTDELMPNRVILCKDFSGLLPYIKNDQQSDFIKERIAAEKDVTLITGKQGITVIQLFRSQKKPVYNELEDARRKAFSIYPLLSEYDAETITVINAGVTASQVLAFSEGLYLTNYRFNKYRSKKEEKDFQLKETVLFSEGITEEDIIAASAVLEGNAFSRDLVNEPLSYLTATKLAEEIVSQGNAAGFPVEVFNKKKIESLRMGGLLAVNKGSIDPPTFSILEWKPEDKVNPRPIVLVGKGVVYDTGGLSLKPTHDSMDYMKCDMSGAAAVAGTFYAISRANLPIHVIGLIPATDNRPDGNAYVPGDVIEMYNGSTVEVMNTDAEGRMILADALSYADRYDPELIIELSTLTGSAHVAVGNYAIVGMGNAKQEEMDALKKSGSITHERIAEFPFWDDYAELLKSDIADLKNIGGRYAGAITAGKFLEKFTTHPFIHLDIAGPAFNKSKDNYRGTGGSGIGVRLLFDYLTSKSKKYNNE
ncbi:MAG: leucyl aminopeptidase [Bacteroidales bacterium]|nr:leucyl aminopeptidase [Bacteroidales bacterium]